MGYGRRLKPFDATVFDSMLPGPHEILRRLPERLIWTPIMMLTAKDGQIGSLVSSNLTQPGGDRLTQSIVVSGFQDLDFVVVCSVDEPVFVVDPPGPVPGQFPLEGFWLSNPGEQVALDLSD
jgi:hypothetical protein